MSKLSFKGVEEATSKFPDFTKPCVADFEVSGVEFKENENNKAYMWVTFVNADGQFRHMFYLTDSSMPRVKHLLKGCGLEDAAIDAIPSTEALEKALVGRKVRMVVDGEAKDGKEAGSTVVYATLRYSGFAERVSVPLESSKLGQPKTIDKRQAGAPASAGSAAPSSGKMPWEQ